MYLHVNVRACICAWATGKMYICTCKCACLGVCVHERRWNMANIRVPVYLHILYVYMCVCVWTFICTYVHTSNASCARVCTHECKHTCTHASRMYAICKHICDFPLKAVILNSCPSAIKGNNTIIYIYIYIYIWVSMVYMHICAVLTKDGEWRNDVSQQPAKQLF